MKTETGKHEPYIRQTAAGPYVTCRSCNGKGGDHIIRCHECLGVGFLPASVYAEMDRARPQKKPPRAA